MSFVTQKGIRIPDVLMFVGVILVGFIAVSATPYARYTLFAGLTLMAGGYLWEKFFVAPPPTSQKVN
jgi:hypothetical protein